VSLKQRLICQKIQRATRIEEEQKEMNLVRTLKKEVTTGANGTQNYVIKHGPNKGKIADKGQ